MAIATVATGAITTAAAASVTPAFGAVTTAGNFLVARVSAQGSIGANDIATTATGWLLVESAIASGAAAAAIWYKENCGAGEAAPTFTCTGATSMSADLVEFSGVATSASLDRHTNAGTNITNPAADATNSDLAVVVLSFVNSKSATYALSHAWTPTGGTQLSTQGTNTTKSVNLHAGSAYALNGHGGAAADNDVISVTPSTGAVSFAVSVLASFKPAGAALAVTYHPVVVSQAVARAGNW